SLAERIHARLCGPRPLVRLEYILYISNYRFPARRHVRAATSNAPWGTTLCRKAAESFSCACACCHWQSSWLLPPTPPTFKASGRAMSTLNVWIDLTCLRLRKALTTAGPPASSSTTIGAHTGRRFRSLSLAQRSSSLSRRSGLPTRDSSVKTGTRLRACGRWASNWCHFEWHAPPQRHDGESPRPTRYSS